LKRCKKLGKSPDFNHVIICRDSVLSNYEPAIRIKEKLISLYNWSIRMRNLAESAGWAYHQDIDFPEDVKQMISNLSLLDLDDHRGRLMITKKMLSHWKTISVDSSGEHAKECYANSMMRVSDRIEKRVDYLKKNTAASD
jgi:hypothetical protein